ncbi:MAG: sulfatase-like hydrolase/transferase, partial [Acidimicrobiales bacterium]|nr:sulfatase-like hydrolase/transferase [Acidimicrobiales bacterium]
MLLGLWGLAVAQPLLDLYGRNGELFVAAREPGGAIVAFALTVTLLPPLALALVQTVVLVVHRGAGRVLHSGLVAVLGALVAATLLRRAGVDAVWIGAPLVLSTGIGLAWGERRSRGLATGLRYLACGPVLFLGAFVLTSQSSRLIWDDAGATAGATVVERPAPVVLLQLDELPLASLLDRGLQVNRARFPNFAALADTATWYPDATANASETSLSVPSVVTGLLPGPDALPTSSDHPRSLFSLLGADYDLDVHETITSLCPASACGDTGRRRATPLSTLLADAAVVYGHVVLPASTRERLPRVDQSWAGFVDGARPVDERPEDATASEPFGTDWADADAFARGPAGQGEELQAVIDGLEAPTGTRPTLTYAHVLLPHEPWLMTPTEQQHSDPAPMLGLTPEGNWSSDVAGPRQGYQRHLLQLGYLDRYLGRLVARLDDLGVWDDALVIVTADHGVAFTADRPLREPTVETLAEVYDVPLFVKYPHQTAGTVDPRNARLIDVLPTIIDVLGVETDWELDGRSLRGEPPQDGARPVVESSVDVLLVDGLDGLAAVVERDHAFLPYSDDWRGVAQIEPYGDLVGVPVAQLTLGDPSPMSFLTYHPVTAYDPASARSPVLRTGVVHLAGGAPPTAGLVAVNGTVAG